MTPKRNDSWLDCNGLDQEGGTLPAMNTKVILRMHSKEPIQPQVLQDLNPLILYNMCNKTYHSMKMVYTVCICIYIYTVYTFNLYIVYIYMIIELI